MKRHLESDEIQNYLDGNLSDKNIIEHISECHHCQIEIKKYQKIYSLLEKELDCQLSANFNEKVISQINSIPIKKRGFFGNIILGSIGLLIGTAVSFYYTGLQPYVGFIDQLRLSFDKYILPFVELLHSLQSNKSVSYVLLSIFIVIIIGVIDRFLFSSDGFHTTSKSSNTFLFL